MKHFHIEDSKGALIAENLTNDCRNCFNNCNFKGNVIPVCPVYGGQRRQGKIENNRSKVEDSEADISKTMFLLQK